MKLDSHCLWWWKAWTQSNKYYGAIKRIFVNLQPPLVNEANDVDNDIHESNIEEGQREFDKTN
jgi:hypothetical protein